MSKPRKKPVPQFHAFLVEPEIGFEPTNWRQTPAHYRIVEYLGPRRFKGGADAWKFMHNHDAIKNGQTQRWAIYLDFETEFFSNQNTVPDQAELNLVG